MCICLFLSTSLVCKENKIRTYMYTIYKRSVFLKNICLKLYTSLLQKKKVYIYFNYFNSKYAKLVFLNYFYKLSKGVLIKKTLQVHRFTGILYTAENSVIFTLESTSRERVVFVKGHLYFMNQN